MKHNLAPVPMPFSPEVAKVLANYPQDKNGYILQLFRVFANSMRFLTNKGVVNLLDEKSPLSLRHREIVILRVTANNDCEYEWGVHVSAFAKVAGLSEAQVAATRTGSHMAECWREDESLLIQCVDQLCTNATVNDETYSQFQLVWTVEQQLEIIALVGNYHTVSFVANTSRLSLEDTGARFPV